MRIYEIGTGYTSIPANKGAATEIVVENLSRALLAQGHDVTVVDIADLGRLQTDLPIVEVSMPRGLSGTDEALGVRHKLKRVVYSLCLARKLRGLLGRENGPVVLHFHNQYNAYFFYKTGAFGRFSHPAVVCYTNHSGVWNTQLWTDIEKTIRGRYFQEIYVQAQADAVCVLNENTARHVSERCGTPQERVFRVRNGVDTETYRPLTAAECEEVRRSLSDDCEHMVFQCASVYPNKNQLGAVRMLEPLLREDRGLHYAYAGGVVDAAYHEEVLRYAEASGLSGQVHYLGELEPGKMLNRYYASAEAFLLPSEYEGFSMALLEAMAAGAPSFVDGRAGVVPLGGEDDGFYMYRSAEHFADLMRGVVYDGEARARVSAAARDLAVREYSWDRVAREYVDAMEQAFYHKIGV